MTDDHREDPPADDGRAPSPESGDDPGANTEMFRAFAQREEPPPSGSTGSSFRVLTLLAGLVVFAAIVWLLLR